MQEKRRYAVLINTFYFLFLLVFAVPLIINHICFKRKKKKKPFAASPLVDLLERHPILYELSIVVWNFPVGRRIYSAVPIEGKDNVLQVGCGTGLFNRLRPEARTVNLDINEKYLAYGVRHGRFQQTVCQSVYDLEFEPGSFSAVLFARCFHHIRHQKKALAVCGRVLEPGGRLIIFDPVSTQKESFKTRLVNTEMDGVVYRYHKETYETYLNSIMPDGFILERLDFIKTPTVTNYNFRYPHVDAVAILMKSGD